jgi:hypothetical protein
MSEEKCKVIIEHFKASRADVLVLVDTRTDTVWAQALYRRLFQTSLSLNVGVAFTSVRPTDAALPAEAAGLVGGVIILSSERLGQCVWKHEDTYKLGISLTVQFRTTGGTLAVTGTYWPPKPSGKRRLEALDQPPSSRLVDRLQSLIHKRGLTLSPLEAIQHDIAAYVVKLVDKHPQLVYVFAGDLNAGWGKHAGTNGDAQLWAGPLSLLHANTGPTPHWIPTFRRGPRWVQAIDHIAYWDHSGLAPTRYRVVCPWDIYAFFDHCVVLASFRLPYSLGDRPNRKMRPYLPNKDLDIRDARCVRRFQKVAQRELHALVAQPPPSLAAHPARPTLTPPADPAAWAPRARTAQEVMQAATAAASDVPVTAVTDWIEAFQRGLGRSVRKAMRVPTRGNPKQLCSVDTMAIREAMRCVVTAERHLFARKQHSVWDTEERVHSGMAALTRAWDKAVRSLDRTNTPAAQVRLRELTGHAPEYWRTQSLQELRRALPTERARLRALLTATACKERYRKCAARNQAILRAKDTGRI